MKRKIVLLTIILFAVQSIFAQTSIKDVLSRFDEKLAQHSIPSAEVMIGSINFGETETNGTAAAWMKDEIAKAAVKMRRIKIVRETLKTVQLETKTRGLVAMMKKPKTAYKKKYTITGKYIENKAKGIVSLTLYLELSEGDKVELFASETATIQSSELLDYGLTLYPQNIEEVKAIEKDFEEAETILESETPSTENAIAKDSVTETKKDMSATEDGRTKTNNRSEAESKKLETDEVVETEELKTENTVQITAYMLDKKNNVVDTLHPGDVVKFLVATDKDAYVRIMGIDAEGNTFWLPIKNNFIKANTVRTFPDDNTLDYQVVDGVFGAEHLFIYAATDKAWLPDETSEQKYHPSLITSTTRGIVAVKKNENITTGVFKIAYTVVP